LGLEFRQANIGVIKMQFTIGETIIHFREAVQIVAIVGNTIYLEVVAGDQKGKLYLSHRYMLEADVLQGNLW
jgi:hypothetical protein